MIMKKMSLFLLISIIAFTPLLQSCDDDDGYSTGNFLITMATVEKESESSVPYFVWEENEAVWVAASYVPFQQLKAGQRVVGNFTLLSDRNDFFVHDVRLNNYSVVLTKDIIDLTEANKDSIGNSKALINRMWIENDYLNVMFQMRVPSKEKHMVNLVRNTTANYPDIGDGYVNLEYRYNDMGDGLGDELLSIVSFKLNLFDVSTDNIKPKGIKVKINSYKNGEYVVTLDDPTQKDGQNKSLPVNLSTGNID